MRFQQAVETGGSHFRGRDRDKYDRGPVGDSAKEAGGQSWEAGGGGQCSLPEIRSSQQGAPGKRILQEKDRSTYHPQDHRASCQPRSALMHYSTHANMF